MSAPVFLADPAVLDAYVPGSQYVLEGAEARHAGVVPVSYTHLTLPTNREV